MPRLFILLITLLPYAATGQHPLSPAAMQEDVQVLREILMKGHPAPTLYTSAAGWDSLWASFTDQLTTPATTAAFFRQVSGLASHVHDGHLRVLRPRLAEVPPLFPIWVQIIGGRLYTDTEEADLPVGTEILAINGELSQTILTKFRKYTPTDGYNLTRCYRQMEAEFGILHFYEYGQQSTYELRCQLPDGTLVERQLLPRAFQKVGARYADRRSLFTSYYAAISGEEYAKVYDPKLPFVYFVGPEPVAVLTVHSFGVDPFQFQEELDEAFKMIKRKKARTLIIDVRQNNGGYRANAINLYRYLAQQPFRQRQREILATSELVVPACIKHTMSDFSAFVEVYFANAKTINQRLVLTTDRAEASMLPHQKSFQGKVYVLAGGKTFSAGSAFALNAQQAPEITLVGEETGGGYYTHTGQFPVTYELPNSKILLTIFLVQIEHYVTDTSARKGQGVMPDVIVEQRMQDLLEGKDSCLEYVLQEAGNGK